MSKVLESLVPDVVKYKYDIFKQFGYVPHRGQDKVHRSMARYRFWAAAARVGKTYMAANEALPYIIDPRGNIIWIVAPTYALTEKIFRVIWHILCEQYPFPVTRKSWREKFIFLANGTQIYGKSCEKPQGLLGEGVNFMICDEMSRISEEVFDQYLRQRLITFSGDFLGISTPCGRGNLFHKQWLHGKSGDPRYANYESFHSTLYDNPLVPRDEIRELRNTLGVTSPASYKQEILGMFISTGGSVFPNWHPEVFVQDVPAIEGKNVEATIDFGVRNPFSCLFLQKSGRQVRFFKELYRPGYSTLDNAKFIKPYFEKYNVKRCVCDPEELDQRLILKQLLPGCTFVPGINDISAGLEVLRDHMTVDPLNNEPLLLIDRSMKNTTFEFEVAKYPKGENEIPIDANNHSIAAMRYYMMKYCNDLKRVNKNAYYSGGERLTGLDDGDSDHSIIDVYNKDQELWMGDNGNEG